MKFIRLTQMNGDPLIIDIEAQPVTSIAKNPHSPGDNSLVRSDDLYMVREACDEVLRLIRNASKE